MPCGGRGEVRNNYKMKKKKTNLCPLGPWGGGGIKVGIARLTIKWKKRLTIKWKKLRPY